MCPGIELAAESGAEELCDNAHILFGQSEHLRQYASHVDHTLCRVIQREHLSFPHRSGGVQLERVVGFGRRDVSLIQLDWRTGKRGFSIAAMTLQSRRSEEHTS